MAEIVRDKALEQAMLQSVIADRNESPRTLQREVGPSSLGGCRELLRASIFEPQLIVPNETHWAAAAHVGQVMGGDLERIFGQRLNAVEQQRITAFFSELGVEISGSIDLLFLAFDMITDLKSTTDMGGTIYDLTKNAELIESLLAIWREGKLFESYVETPDGAYEHTEVLLRKFSKLHYYVQVAVYVVGAIQQGLIDADKASGRLVFYDRAGDFQEFLALVMTAEEIAMFFDIGEARVQQVVRAQDLLEQGGNPALIHQLRDMTPSYCFSRKVMCPLRDRCWGGSDFDPEDVIISADLAAAADRYAEGRRLATLADGMKKAAKEELKGITGRFTNGLAVGWDARGYIQVTETSGSEVANVSTVDAAVASMARVRKTEPMKIEITSRPEGEPAPYMLDGSAYGVEAENAAADSVSPQPVDEPVEKPKRKRAPAGHGKRGHKPEGCAQCAEEEAIHRSESTDIEGLPVAYTDAKVVLEKSRATLTPAQIAYLESKVAAGPTTPRHEPLSGDELKAALEADTAAGRLRQMQDAVETGGQVARIRDNR